MKLNTGTVDILFGKINCFLNTISNFFSEDFYFERTWLLLLKRSESLAHYSSTVRREIVIDASHFQEKTKVRQSKQATLNINGSAVAQQRSITHSSALQSGEITVENSDWPTICNLSFDSSALSWPQWASVFVFMLPYSFFFSHSLGEFPTQDLFGRQTQTHCNLGSSAASASHVITGQEVKGLNQEKAQLWGSLALKYIIWVCYFKCQKNHACAVVT